MLAHVLSHKLPMKLKSYLKCTCFMWFDARHTQNAIYFVAAIISCIEQFWAFVLKTNESVACSAAYASHTHTNICLIYELIIWKSFPSKESQYLYFNFIDTFRKSISIRMVFVPNELGQFSSFEIFYCSVTTSLFSH